MTLPYSQPHDPARRIPVPLQLNRQEFMQLIARAAAMRFMMPAVAGIPAPFPDAAEAVAQMLDVQMLPRVQRALGESSMLSANEFRKRFCYNESTSDVLRRHEAVVRLLFGQYAWGDGSANNPLASRTHLGYDEWRLLLSDLGLADNFAFGERQATAAFVLSRMRVLKESDTRGRARILQLCFEDLCEALVRIALYKSFPTAAQVKASGCLDAGHYLLRLWYDSKGGAAWEEYLRRPRPALSADQAIEALMTLIIRSVHAALGRPIDTPSLELTAADVEAFAKQHGWSGASSVVVAES
jgi:hypothetical protein